MKWYEIAYTFTDIPESGVHHCLSYGESREAAISNFYKCGAGLHVICLDCVACDIHDGTLSY